LCARAGVSARYLH